MLRDAIEHSAIDTEFMPPWGAGEGRQSEPRWRTVAKAALTGLGWRPAIAHAAVAAALEAAHDAEMTLERLIFDALRRCPAPKA